jgi:hypothetical protein
MRWKPLVLVKCLKTAQNIIGGARLVAGVPLLLL